MLEKLFNSRLRAKALGWMLTHPDERFYVRQLTQLIGEDSANLSRELIRLANMGILTCRREGRQKYYQVSRDCPVFPELRGLAVKTFGMGDLLRDALRPLSARVRAAFLFGSFATGSQTAQSDVDLMIVGDVSLGEVAGALRNAEAALAREVNPSVYPAKEFRAKARAGHHFITEVLKSEKIFLIGDEHVLERLVG
jgi:predicted nucleotidyltransferase